MCGFFGVLSPEQKLIESIGSHLEVPAEILRHRGPDDKQYFEDKEFRSVFLRLSIVDVEHGAQPMRSHSGKSVILFNGEIYNYQVLRRNLEARGHRFLTTSDTEVLVNFFEEEGFSGLSKLEGMFAFAIWQPAEKCLILVRDANGIKPLYYTQQNHSVIFSSELKAIRPCLEKAYLNEHILPSWLTLQAYAEDETLLKSCFRVQPGNYLVFRGGHRVRQGSFLPEIPVNPILDVGAQNGECETFRNLINSSVDLALYTEVPYSFHLSGGMDTGLLLSLAKKKGLHDFLTFTTFTGEDEEAELESIKQSRHFFPGEHCSIHLNRGQFYGSWKDLAYSLDEPLGDAGYFAQYMTNQEIKRHGSKISFTGHGIDEYFGGYARYLFCVVRECFSMNDLGLKLLPDDDLDRILQLLSPYRHMWKKVSAEKSNASLFSFFLEFMIRDKNSSEALRNQGVSVKEVAFQIEKKLREKLKNRSDWSLINYFDATVTLPSLLHMEDRASMRWSVEARVPYVNYQTLSFSLKYALSAKIKGGKTKAFIRNSFQDALPPHLVHQIHKVGRPTPVNRWMLAEENKEKLAGLLGRGSRLDHLFATDYLEGLANTNNPYDRRLWGVTLLGLWMETFNIDLKS